MMMKNQIQLFCINLVGDLKVSYVVMQCLLCALYIVLNKYIDTLDKRVERVASKYKDGIVAKKVRRLGEPSLSSFPANAPSWAIKKSSSCQDEIPAGIK